mgnify:CR=1 FL=1
MRRWDRYAPPRRLLQALPFYPLTSDQLTMLEEESVTDPAAFYADFRLVPSPWTRGRDAC